MQYPITDTSFLLFGNRFRPSNKLFSKYICISGGESCLLYYRRIIAIISTIRVREASCQARVLDARKKKENKIYLSLL